MSSFSNHQFLGIGSNFLLLSSRIQLTLEEAQSRALKVVRRLFLHTISSEGSMVKKVPTELNLVEMISFLHKRFPDEVLSFLFILIFCLLFLKSFSTLDHQPFRHQQEDDGELHEGGNTTGITSPFPSAEPDLSLRFSRGVLGWGRRDQSHRLQARGVNPIL